LTNAQKHDKFRSYKSIVMRQSKLEHLQNKFPKLTEFNQFYILGLAEGFRQAQGSNPKEAPKTVKPCSRKKIVTR